MNLDAPPRPKLKHAMTATAYALVQIRMTWAHYFRALRVEHRRLVEKDRRGWGA